MRLEAIVGAALAAALALPVTVHAEEGTRRLSRGVDDVVSGPMALPDQLAEETAARGPAAGVPVGLARGVGTMVWREASGVYGIARSLGDADVVIDPEQVSELQRACGRQGLRVGQ
jgi:putative exosortase-associated protein (TIGR04073 family)